LKLCLATMATEREQLTEKLTAFFKQHDPERLKNGIEAVVDFGLAEGLPVLNAALMDRYGSSLDQGSDYLLDSGDRQILRTQIEVFFVKHDASKLDKPADVSAIIEWALINGIDVLSDKLFRKYGEGLEEVSETDVLVILESFYNKHDKNKTEEEIRKVLTFGIVNGFCTLNQKLIDKYGEGLGSMNREKVKADIREKLVAFYSVHASAKVEDPENIDFVLSLALKHGLNYLNRLLQKKYQHNLYSIARMSTDRRTDKPRAASLRKSQRRSSRSSKGKSKGKPRPPSKPKDPRKSGEMSAEEVVEEDYKYQEYLRKLVEIFYARHDPQRLLEEGVTPILNYAIAKGERALNDKLRDKYGEDLADLDEEFQALRERLIQFYARFEPSKLEPENESQLDTVVGWGLVNGYERLNKTLLKKYDDDLDWNGLKARLRLFYQAVGAKKTEKDIGELVEWAGENSVEDLNKKLKKRYGKSLEDTTFAETNETTDALPQVEDLPSRPPPKPKQPKKYQGNAPLPKTAPPRPPNFEMLAQSQEKMRASTHAALESKLITFYRKKDPAKANEKAIAFDIQRIMRDGVEAFNADLLNQYGESLNSLEKGTRSLSKSQRNSDKRGNPLDPTSRWSEVTDDKSV